LELVDVSSTHARAIQNEEYFLDSLIETLSPAPGMAAEARKQRIPALSRQTNSLVELDFANDFVNLIGHGWVLMRILQS
jgi:hypothetical protein